MHQLIASYLFQNKTCPLPGLGTLSIHTGRAETDFSNHRITAPEPVIEFKERETSATGLLNYVAHKTNSDQHEVTEALDHFCDHLKNEISVHSKAVLAGVGSFVAGHNGNIIFEQAALPAVFLNPVTAERVIHPKTEHTILVGDKEMTNRIMTEYFNIAPSVKDKWWIWAIVLGLIGLLILLYYFTATNGISLFGNSIKI